MPGSTAGLLAAWASAYLQQLTSLDHALEEVLGHKSSSVQQASPQPDGPPWDRTGPGVELVPAGESASLAELLLVLRRLDVTRLHAAFPIAGDADGVGPGPGLAPAYAAGAAVLLPCLGLVIVPSFEDADRIELSVYQSPSRVQYVSVSEATMELTEAIQRSTSIFTNLDVASWNPRLGRVSARALDEVGAPRLPEQCPTRATHLLVRAHQLDSLLGAAAGDPGGGSVSSHEAAARDAALAPLRRNVSRSLSAAYNSLPQ